MKKINSSKKVSTKKVSIKKSVVRKNNDPGQKPPPTGDN